MIRIIFTLTLIKFGLAYYCEEIVNTNMSNYKGSCCTIRDFNSANDNDTDYFIEGLNNTKINKVVFINFTQENVPRKIFEVNPLILDLNITQGGLQNIEKGDFSHAGALNFLILVRNKIKYLNETCFNGAKFLYKLDLKGNLISHIDGTAFQTLEYLSYLYLDGNLIEIIDSNIFLPLKRLFKLTLSNNRIKSVHPNMVFGCYKLDQLDLSRNLLTGKLTLQNKYNEICLINIAENDLSAFELTADVSISRKALHLTIIARNNALSNVTISSNYNLSYLNLFDNKIESINFIVKDHCNITHINIGKNPLKTHDFPKWDLKNLKYLNMSLNTFQNLSNKTFSDLPELQILDLSNVNLAQPLQLKSLQNLKNLEILDLSNLYVDQIDPKDALKHILPNLKCLKHNKTNGWMCEIPSSDVQNEANDRPMQINIEINSKEVPLWMKISFISSIVMLVLVCILTICIRRKERHHQVINNINVGSTTTELEML